jgi:hypothetical protein
VLTVASLEVSVVFGRTRAVLVVLALALFVSVWFDYSRLGYLDKIVGFPATLLVVGLFFEFCRLISIGKEVPLAALGALAVLVICTVIMFNAQLTALGLAAFGSLFLIVRLIWGQTRLLCRPYDRQIGFDSGGVDRPRDYLKRDDCSTEFNGRRLESLNGLGLPSRKSGGNYWATSLRRSFEDYYCSGVCVYLHSSDCQEIIGSDCIGVGSIAVGDALYAFDQKLRFYEITPLFSVTPVVLRLFS